MKGRPLLLVLGLLYASRALAQKVDGNLEGRILDSDGRPLPNATATATGSPLQGARHTASDRAGTFRLTALPVGSYHLEVSHVAHQPVTYEDVVVQLGATTQLGTIQLEKAVVEIPKVVVTGARRLLDPATAALGIRLSADAIEPLPTDRNFRSLVTLAPEATSGFTGEEPSVAGSTGEGNYYFIDGADVTDPAGAGSSINLPYDFIRAIEIETGGYEAEYGRALGGIVNVITPSGGNELHGQVFSYFTNHRLIGKSRSSLLEASGANFFAYDVGGSLGGPLLPDRLWWFAAYNPALDSRDIEVPGIAAQEANSTIHRLAGKLSWQPDPRTNLNLTVLGDPARSRIVGVPFGFASPPALVLNEDAMVATTRTGGVNVSLHALHQLRPHLLLRGSVSRVHNRSFVTPISERGETEPFFIDFETNTVSGGYGGENKNASDRTAGRVSLTAFLGRHMLKTGLEYTDNSITTDIQFGAGKEHRGFLFQNSDSSFFWYQGFSLGTVHMRVPTVYAQDSWRATDRLRLNVGLRWDGNDLEGSGGGPSLKITDGFQPRVGFTYQLGPLGTQQVAGSYGRYFEQLPTGSPGYYFFDSMQLSILYDHNPLEDASGGDSTALLPSPPGISGVQGQNFDEYILGYERELGFHLKGSVRGRYRTLRQVVEDAYSPSAQRFLIGNPGRGVLSYLPEAKQEYKALEITLEGPVGTRGEVFASYVLSRNFGNYAGLLSGNAGPQFDFVESIPNSTGLLPNNRTHVFKVHGSYRVARGLRAGAIFLRQSGTPVNELGAHPNVPYGPVFLRPRGSVGRTQALWDLNLRLAYDGWRVSDSVRPRVVLDLFHVFSPRHAIQLDERHFFATDESGNQTAVNPNYLKPTLYQPALSARLGAGLAF